MSSSVTPNPVMSSVKRADSDMCLSSKPGEAQVKKEFLIFDKPTRELDLQHVCEKDKARLIINNADELMKDGGMMARDESKLSDDEMNHDTMNRSSKRQKLKGQNKKRKFRKEKKGEKEKYQAFKGPCLRFVSSYGTSLDGCKFGDKCKYGHDIDAYASKKVDLIGDKCLFFENQGFCPYGLLCRYNSRHLDSKDNRSNIVEVEKYAKFNELPPSYRNQLPKDLVFELRKKSHNFEKSTKALKVTSEKVFGPIVDDVDNRKPVNFESKLYLAPLTTIGNLPFRRVCKELGADITCGEMAMATNILEGQTSEWALLRRHKSEDIFGVQLCGGFPDTITKAAQLITEYCEVDFIDINMGCPIDCIFQKGAGSGLMTKINRLNGMIWSMSKVTQVPITLKMRTGIHAHKNTADKIIADVSSHWSRKTVGLFTVHGRSREQRYTKSADWEYVNKCANASQNIPVFGSGDIMSFQDYYEKLDKYPKLAGVMIGRGAIIKPWLFTEIKEKRNWDISSKERLEILQNFVNYGLEHWGSDTSGVEKTRRFLLEWLSFLYRYIPVGLLEVLPQKINERPPMYKGRDELETLFASPSCSDWVKISEMLLGKVASDFVFLPKHKANAYQVSDMNSLVQENKETGDDPSLDQKDPPF
ncbi:dihydrouridine synthase 3 [Brevipalpus obovatus]|uniref:dihydrouridine synthase 3 n=1 Tax=Brevipalpus obovatus TaxID=246614 RepID=UPI003D9E65DB